mmetsp:Transcript_10434/g.15808  ORF Transcript_10434/g.15808 Transcript_10434/m.15808 type:complete len:418 (-) Transcript_10434:105-1358(-)|eukprot:CAMPEP_0194084778 /NCGR_PEP_ID=MMETSP0149-20130528/14885_1 /TAXON_ID=122233 /ORGANISM="Chaetoceros debilis, Strain MM31A-1" /LENGTH=417 /DNA_ID=CAMNT_0038767527 /DNA_START=99 /DNA_END=1352 /DNA_ORIENTATION=+
MPPRDFIEARNLGVVAIVDNKPYYPNLSVETNADGSNDPPRESLLDTALQIIFHGASTPDGLRENLSVRHVTGGLTNALYCISGFAGNTDENGNVDEVLDCKLGYDSILVRVFGAEGMINRDVETSTFAFLAEYGVAPPYHGRFANGRLEGWLVDCVPLTIMDLQKPSITNHVAVEMAKLHCGFKVPEELKEWHNEAEPGMWHQLFEWMDQTKNIKEYKSKGDEERAKRLINLGKIENELNWLKETVIPADAAISFCHNDLLSANIMKHSQSGEIKLIDFEYGGVNYSSFDIANHFNEHAGGTDKKDGVPDYELFPDDKQQREFITTYVRKTYSLRNSSADDVEEGSKELEEEIDTLCIEVQAFVLVNHLYWGLWAVNQSAAEGTDEFDYLAYAFNRFARYTEEKFEFERKPKVYDA